MAVASHEALMNHEDFMDIALRLGRRGLGNTWPNPSVGCVIVAQGAYGPAIIARGWTAPGGRPHAETQALARAGDLVKGARLYVTLEPCSHHGKTSPCSEAIIKAGIGHVVCALKDPDSRVAGRGFAQLRAAGIRVDVGIGAKTARRDLGGYLMRMNENRPFVRLKLAVSKNYKIAAEGGKQIWLTGDEVRSQVHMMRARHDAIMVGAGTVRADDPDLTCRLPGLEKFSPVRVVVDSLLGIASDSNLCRTAKQVPVWVLTTADAPEAKARELAALGVEVIFCPKGVSRQVDLPAAMGELAKRGITRLLVEGGARLAASMLEEKLIDEADIFFAPKEIDAAGVDALYGKELSAVSNSSDFTCIASRKFGDDILRCYVRS